MGGAGRRQSELFIVVIAVVSHNRGSSGSRQSLNSLEGVSPAPTVTVVSVAVASIADGRRCGTDSILHLVFGELDVPLASVDHVDGSYYALEGERRADALSINNYVKFLLHSHNGVNVRVMVEVNIEGGLVGTDVRRARRVHTELMFRSAASAVASVHESQPGSLTVELVAPLSACLDSVFPVGHDQDGARLIVVNRESHVADRLVDELGLDAGSSGEGDDELDDLGGGDHGDVVDLGGELDGVDASIASISCVDY